MSTFPDNVRDARAQGWIMVCILPSYPNAYAILESVIPHFDEVEREAKFTRKGHFLDATQTAVWVKGFKWSLAGRDLLLQILHQQGFASKQLRIFAHLALKDHMPPEAIELTPMPRRNRFMPRKTREARAQTGGK